MAHRQRKHRATISGSTRGRGGTNTTAETLYEPAIVIYEEDGQTAVKRVQVRPDGTYELILLNGRYVVDIGRSGIDSTADLPVTVQVNGGQITFDIDIDTSIR